jgi:hypothetical protein
MEKISWIDRVRNAVLQGVKDDSNNIKTIRRKAKRTAHILPSKTRYRKKDGGKDRSDGKARKET